MLFTYFTTKEQIWSRYTLCDCYETWEGLEGDQRAILQEEQCLSWWCGSQDTSNITRMVEIGFFCFAFACLLMYELKQLRLD